MYIDKFNKDRKVKLYYVVAIDLVGYLSYTIPGVAEIIDVVWAPFGAVLIFLLFKFKPKIAFVGALGALVEEFIPGFDFIPTASLLWLLIYVIDKEDTLEVYKALEEEAIVIVEEDET